MKDQKKAMMWALYWIFSVKDQRDKLIVFFWNFLFGLLYLILFGLTLIFLGIFVQQLKPRYEKFKHG